MNNVLYYVERAQIKTNAKHINSNSVIKNVPKLQKTINKITDDAIFFIASAVLIYFISYFFIFIHENRMKIIAFDYSTALMSLILPIIFFAVIYIFYRIK
jgi:hypothetical protein